MQGPFGLNLSGKRTEQTGFPVPRAGAGDVPVSCPDRGASPRSGFFRAFSGGSGEGELTAMASLQSALLEVVSSINNYLSS